NLEDLKSKIRFVHITGKHFFNEVKESYDKFGFTNRCFKFYGQMSALYDCVDFALCRAGSGTLTELFMAKIPALVVPLPYAADNHQLANANVFAASQVFDVIEEKDCTARIISDKIRYYFCNPDELKKKKNKIFSIDMENASEKMIRELVNDRILKK
ncbi:UDP-N-acetylglucosamine--N-acetylmuramyl-(pentapeptide) pyrophosphoryl-undecaprenol N-acetylglucosamine transferase, partial [bacterium]|nr:UDP-N-acetylglucosamine--N-acetylmuramyl-(pentapeptide) pyrophosphoryl-undecaprenol N-acetylglucosamine transferase [bacterium]